MYILQTLIQVILYNRQEDHYTISDHSERLSNAQVNIGNDPYGKNSPMCGKVGDTTGKRVLEITCTPPLQGRYVNVSVPRALVLCEVEVFGGPADEGESRS